MSSSPQDLPTLDFKPLVLDSKKFEILWERYQNVPMAFKPEWYNKQNFLGYFNNPSSLFFEIGECAGLGCAHAINPGLSAIVDFVMFDKVLRGREKLFHDIIKEIFSLTRAMRLTGLVPNSKNVSQRLLLRLGFRREGRMRNAYKSPKGYEDLIILGLLKNSVENWRDPNSERVEGSFTLGDNLLSGETTSSGELSTGYLGVDVEQLNKSKGGGDNSVEEGS